MMQCYVDGTDLLIIKAEKKKNPPKMRFVHWYILGP